MSSRSKQDWLLALKATLPPPDARVAVLGIGNELRGDDAAGVLVARRLAKTHSDRALVFDGGQTPENCTSALRRFRPAFILLIDAALIEAPVGTIRYLELEQALESSATTHSLSLHLLATYLSTEFECRFGVLGIQPGHTEFNQPLSPPVRNAVRTITRQLNALLIAASG